MEYSKDAFEAIFQSAPDAIIVVNKQGKIIAANNKVPSLFGFSADEIKDLVVEDFLPTIYRDIHKEHRDHYWQSLKAREMAASKDLLAKRKNGSEFYVEISLSPIAINGEVYVSASIRDVSEKIALTGEIKATLLALEQKNKELEQFAFIVSHDLQDPLKTIIGLTGIIVEDCKDKMDEKAKQYIDSIYQSTSRMSELIEVLLEFSRLGNTGAKTEVNTAKMMADIVADLAAVIDVSNAKIVYGNLPLVKGHATHLRILFQNLLSNAIKFRKKDDELSIAITARTEGTQWVFSIQDNGIGISEENLEKIFIIFKRLHSRSEYEGTGIGLAHCKKIVEMHGGSIWVDSVPGKGSTFYFTIPMN